MDLLLAPSVFDYDTYLAEIKALFEDQETIFYLDTCFLSQLYKVNSAIRGDFYKWVELHKNSIKMPYWAYCEYTRRAVNSMGFNEFYSLSSISNRISNVIDGFQQIKILVDDKRAKKIGYSKKEDFLNALNETQSTLLKIAREFKNNDEIQDVSDEVNKFLSEIIMPCNLEITNDLKVQFDIRKENKIPPGFDEDKKENVIGDFIIWKEILNNINENKYTKVIFLTNDMKKDWVYSPQKIIYNGKTVSNNNSKTNDSDLFLPARITDPRLEKEFYDIAQTRDFYVVNFKFFSALMDDIDPSTYPNLLSYITVSSEEEKSDSITDDEKNDTAKDCSESKDIDEILGIKYNGIADSIISDSKYVEYQNVIKGLKSYTWDKQSGALYDAKKLDFTKLGKTEKFILGRNIYQSACGNEFDAVFLINNIEHISDAFSDEETCRYIVMGMLFEVYFNSKGEVRKEFKNKYLQKLFKMRNIYSEEFRKVGEYLKSKSNSFVYYPGDNERYEFSFTVSDVNGSVNSVTVKEVNSIKINGHEILFDKYDEDSVGHYFSLTRDYYTYESIKDIFSVRLCIPYDLIDFNGLQDNHARISIKKFVTIDSIKNNNYNRLVR